MAIIEAQGLNIQFPLYHVASRSLKKRLLAKAAEAVIAEGAAAVVLGGAGLAGLAPAVAAHLPVPVLDSLDCLMEASLGEPLPFLPPPSSAPSLDLSPALARRLGG